MRGRLPFGSEQTENRIVRIGHDGEATNAEYILCRSA